MSSDDSYPHSKNSHHKPENWINRIGHIIKGDPADKEDLAEIITDAGEREIIDEDTEDMLKGVFEISELRVRDIMIPRSQMVTISAEYSIDRAAAEIINSGHSRYPVIHEDKDHIEGILLAKDLLKFIVNKDTGAKLKDIIRPAVVIPESKHVDRLLKEFQQCRYHMAIVVDEYGGVSGLVTIEDILELIVGEIEDEYDNDDDSQEQIVQVNENTYHIASLTSIEDFNAKFGTEYTDDEYDTIGGMVMHAIGHLPVKGETTRIDNLEFKILSTVKHSTSLLQLTILPKEEDE